MRLEELAPAELRRLLDSPLIGEAQRDRIRGMLGEPAPLAAAQHAHQLLPVAPAQATVRRGVQNKTELRYAEQVLQPMKARGEILRYEFEAITWHVHGVARYTPDYVVTLPDGSLWFVEVKGGFIREKDRLRFRLHAQARPWHRWTMVQWKGGKWRTVQDARPGGKQKPGQ